MHPNTAGQKSCGSTEEGGFTCKWTGVGGGREQFLRGQSELGVKGFVLTDEYIAG